MRKTGLLLLLMLSWTAVDAQVTYDKRFQLGIEGGMQFGIPPFRHSQQNSLNGTVSSGYSFGLYGCLPFPPAPRWVFGFQFRYFDFYGPDGAREAMLYRRFSDPGFYTTVRTTEIGTQLMQYGLTLGYRLPVQVVELTVTAGINSGSYSGGEHYSIYRKQKEDNYSEEITINGSGNEANPEQFFYPSLQLLAARKLYRRLHVTAAASFHGGTPIETHYAVHREGLFGERSDELFSERQAIFHAGASIGLQLRFGPNP